LKYQDDLDSLERPITPRAESIILQEAVYTFMKNNRLVELDSLRGIAALAVVLFHYLFRYDQIYGHAFDVSALLEYGYYGVHLFFIISGFVIYWTLSRCKTSLDFIWSRFTRLYPVFWAALLTTYFVTLVFALPGREPEWLTLVANFFMFHEYFGFPHVDGVYWTLSIELAFYFWMVTIYSLGQTKHIDQILIVWVGACVLLDVLAISLSFRVESFLIVHYIEFFAIGVCFYKYKHMSTSWWTHALLAVCALSLFASYPLVPALMFAGFMLVLALIVVDRAALLRNRVLVYFGAISYALYLIHQNVGYVVILKMYELNASPIVGVLVAIATSVGLAHLLMTCVERPALRYLRARYKERQAVQGVW
jgi:peptidoglycan/LPS O-acetylase OafA/YrhL